MCLTKSLIIVNMWSIQKNSLTFVHLRYAFIYCITKIGKKIVSKVFIEIVNLTLDIYIFGYNRIFKTYMCIWYWNINKVPTCFALKFWFDDPPLAVCFLFESWESCFWFSPFCKQQTNVKYASMTAH